MSIARLRQVGGSVVVAIPPALLSRSGLSAGSVVEVALEGDRIVLVPSRDRPRRSLADLLAECDPEAPMPTEDTGWAGGAPAGGELV